MPVTSGTTGGMMPLAQTGEEMIRTSLTRPVVVSTLDGVTTALVAFVLVGLVWPHIVKKQREFYAIVAIVIVIILFHALTVMLQSGGFTVFAGVITGLLQAIAFGLAVMSTGGLGAKQLAGEIGKSYEVMRRGSEEKEVIIPIEGMQPKKKPQEESDHVVFTIDTPPGPANPPGPAKPPPGSGSIPME
jgi:hypothetical protein